MNKNELPDIEFVAERVHNSWWKEKQQQGFHAPVDCDSKAHKDFLSLSEHERKETYGAGFNEKRNKWCDKCHPNMYPYEELTEAEKELDRATVRSVYEAIRTAASS